MSGAGSGEMHVSSWGRWTDEDGVEWQRWSVRVHNERVGYLELPPAQSAIEAIVVATVGWDS